MSYMNPVDYDHKLTFSALALYQSKLEALNLILVLFQQLP